MPLTLWRLVKARHAANAFDGEGARRYGGRWNERGTRIVYLGGSLSLAALETFVHLTAADARIAFAAIEVRVPDDVEVSSLAPGALPENWRLEPPPEQTKVIGTDWAMREDSLLLRVPSVIVPKEWNYLLNPGHRAFRQLEIFPPVAFGFDERMWK
jgi:RES domain-containing protein